MNEKAEETSTGISQDMAEAALSTAGAVIQESTEAINEGIQDVASMIELNARATLAAAFIKAQGGLDVDAFSEAWELVSGPYKSEENPEE